MYCVLFIFHPDDEQGSGTNEQKNTQEESHFERLEGMKLCMLLNAVTVQFMNCMYMVVCHVESK